MRPVIGITCRRLEGGGTDQYALARPYISAVEKSGGIPVILPPISKPERPLSLICQGLILSGGGDPDPELFNELPHPKLASVDRERDDWEIILCKTAYEEGVPILGICRGMQILNIALGGDIYQDISDARTRSLPETSEHMQNAPPEEPTHRLLIDVESRLFSILRQDRIQCNSLHHQTLRRVAPQLKAVAWSEDNLIEAVETQASITGKEFILGVQWHPERLRGSLADRIFMEFIACSSKPTCADRRLRSTNCII